MMTKAIRQQLCPAILETAAKSYKEKDRGQWRLTYLGRDKVTDIL